MRSILVPTDFSPQAENALKVAVQLAKKFDCPIYLLHSLNIPLHLGRSGSKEAIPESVYFMKLAEKNFEELLEKQFLKDVETHEAVGHNEIYNDVMEAVEKNQIDLIVMGSHGASGFKEMFIGSNTEKVVRTSNVPVLVIKGQHDNFEITDFAFASDFSEECKKPFEKARKFAADLNASLHLLYVNTPNGFKTTTQTDALMQQFVQNMQGEEYTFNVYNDSSVEKGILNFARENNIQLIGMSTHGRQGLAHFFNGSISEDLVNHANMPVITFRI